jgi:hypothetical protein
VGFGSLSRKLFAEKKTSGSWFFLLASRTLEEGSTG